MIAYNLLQRLFLLAHSLSFAQPTLPSLDLCLVHVSIGYKYSIEQFSVMRLDWWWPLAGLTWIPPVLECCPVVPTLRHHAHLLMMSLTAYLIMCDVQGERYT